MSGGVPRPIRAIAGVLALVALLLVVNGWYREYRGDPDPGTRSVEATVTPEAGDDASDSTDDDTGDNGPDEAAGDPGTGGTVVVVIEGLNFRRAASTDSELIRGLGRGDELTHLGTENGWYHVRDSAGVEGYVSANPQYTELKE